MARRLLDLDTRTEMKKIEAIISPFKLAAVREALEKEQIHRVTIFEVKGAGSQQGKTHCYHGAHYLEEEPEIKVEVVTEDNDVKQVRDSIVTVLRTGALCDAEVVILLMEEVVRVRTGRC
jgi:nitrogen regulatory protein P-II 1